MSKHKEHKALVGRVKKAVKKTRRKLSEDQFNKELQRTISFLSELKDHVSHLQAQEKATVKVTAKAPAKALVKAPVKAMIPAGAQLKTKTARPAKKAKPAVAKAKK
jgi:hypothetical protein